MPDDFLVPREGYDALYDRCERYAQERNEANAARDKLREQVVDLRDEREDDKKGLRRIRKERDTTQQELQVLKQRIRLGKPPRQKSGKKTTHRGTRKQKEPAEGKS